MSDIRHCDGPNCDITAELNADDFVPVNWSDVSAERFIVLERGHGSKPLHFHSNRCLNDWTNQRVSNQERSPRANQH